MIAINSAHARIMERTLSDRRWYGTKTETAIKCRETATSASAAFTCECVYVCVYVYVKCRETATSASAAFTCECVYVCVCVCVRTVVCVCIYIYIYMYTHILICMCMLVAL